MPDNTQVLVRQLPQGKLAASDYEIARTPLRHPNAGEVLCETLAFAITAGTRAGLQGSASYAGAPKTGVVMNGTGVARVLDSNSPRFIPGDLVLGPTGWQSHPILTEPQLTMLPEGDDPIDYLGPLGVNGLTAYFGLLHVGEPKAGDTVLVSAAAGSVGHLVGQIARIRGARAVGVCGSDAKGHTLVNDLGFAAAVNYREDNFREALKAACPDGVDVYFDNTGGDVLGAALFRMNVGGRISCCGVVSQYDTDSPAPGPKGIPGLLVNKRLTMRGFLLFDFADQFAAAREDIRGWLKSGELTPLVDVVEGLEAAPEAFVDLLAGGNTGTRIVRLAG